MKNGYLALFDVSGIQEFIFSTPKLREVIGASTLVGKILGEELQAVIKASPTLGDAFNYDWEDPQEPFPSDKKTAGEIVYIGGGNAMLYFSDLKDFEWVKEKLAVRVLAKTEKLTVVAAAVPCTGDFLTDQSSLYRQLGQKKAVITRQSFFSGEPLFSQEATTGQGITSASKNTGDLSLVKDRHYEEWEQEMAQSADAITATLRAEGYEASKAFNEMGRDQNSFMAVVHIDGNNMGHMIHQWTAGLHAYNRAIPVYRRISIALREAYDRAVSRGLKRAWMALKPILEQDGIHQGGTLPFRHIVFAGDDLTFVCRASYALTIVREILAAIEEETVRIEDREEHLSACGGIAYVKSHYPFSVAYKLAEELCGRAKQPLKVTAEPLSASFLDYHKIYAGMETDLDRIRKREYPGPLHRPILISKEVGPELSGHLHYESIESLFEAFDFKNDGHHWTRNHLKDLRSAWQKGEDQVVSYLQYRSSRNNAVPEVLRKAMLELQEPTDLASAIMRTGLMEVIELFDELEERKMRKEGSHA